MKPLVAEPVPPSIAPTPSGVVSHEHMASRAFLVRTLLNTIAGVLAPLALALPAAAELSFSHVVIDSLNPTNPHCKTLGDIDGDGLIDAIAASSSGAGMFWYEYPTWTKYAIRASGSWTTDMQVGDVDGDGDLDVVIPNGTALNWYENARPGLDPRVEANWAEHQIGTAGANHHDVELGDIDSNGLLDVVSRKKNGSDTSFWRQAPANVWTRSRFRPARERAHRWEISTATAISTWRTTASGSSRSHQRVGVLAPLIQHG